MAMRALAEELKATGANCTDAGVGPDCQLDDLDRQVKPRGLTDCAEITAAA